MTVRVRPMAPSDAEEVARLCGQLGYPSSADQIERRFRAMEPLADSAIFVAAEAGRLLGWGHVIGRRLLESEPFAELAGLVVDEAARRRGIGRALVEAAERWARDRGYEAMRVRSNVVRKPARPFYERLGYAVGKTQYVFGKILG